MITKTSARMEETQYSKKPQEIYAHPMLNMLEVAYLSKIFVEAVSDYFLWFLSFTYFF